MAQKPGDLVGVVPKTKLNSWGGKTRRRGRIHSKRKKAK